MRTTLCRLAGLFRRSRRDAALDEEGRRIWICWPPTTSAAASRRKGRGSRPDARSEESSR